MIFAKVQTPSLLNLVRFLCSYNLLTTVLSHYGKELKYQINDTGTKVFFVGRETVDIITHCLKLLGMSTDKVFLLTTEKSKRTDGVKTVGDLLEYGEIDWERPRNYDEMHERLSIIRLLLRMCTG